MCIRDSPTCIGSYTFNVPGVYTYDCSIGNHAQQGMVATITVGTGGCNDEAAFNYDPEADFDDGSCVDSVGGCSNSDAVNYNDLATIDDGSCLFDQSYVDSIFDAGVASVDCSDVEDDCPADLDGDGSVSISDHLVFLSSFGLICE